VYIDVKKARAAGVTIHSIEEVVKDLDRLAAEHPHLRARIDKLKKVITEVEGEVLLEGNVPGPGAILSGFFGALIFGTAGYFGADWIADHLDAN
jgi:hypothetical protein